MKHIQTWLMAHITVTPDIVDQATALLFDLNPNGIEEKAESGDKTVLTAYFEKGIRSTRELEAYIREALPSCKVMVSEMRWDTCDDRWRQYFSAFAIVPGIVVAPTWEIPPPRDDQRVIIMDPGMAFGTGLHPTTTMCAEAIYTVEQSADVASLLDVGCGSGILCLVGHMLGITTIEGVEIDEVAADVARRNMKMNDAEDIVVHNDINKVNGTFDLVVANILLNTLVELQSKLIEATSPGGHIVLSGITDDQIDELQRAYETQVRCENILSDDEWRCIIFKR